MPHLFIIFTISVCLLSLEAQKKFKKNQLSPYAVLKIQNIGLSESHPLEYALITGNKSRLIRKTRKLLRSYGLSHLFTPSGLHYSSVFLLFRFHKKVRYTFTLFSFILSFFLPGLWSLKRVTIFHFIRNFGINPKAAFYGTFIIAITLGHYKESTLSIIFSFLFWGTLLFYKQHRAKLIIHFFLIQFFLAIIMGTNLNILTFVVNPLLTLIISTLFPLALTTSIFNFFPRIRFNIFDALEHVLSVSYLNSLNLYNNIFLLLFLIIILNIKNNKVLIFILLLLPLHKNYDHSLYKSSQQLVSPLPPYSEKLHTRNNRLYFIDRVCVRKELDFECKKRPIYNGGPNI